MPIWSGCTSSCPARPSSQVGFLDRAGAWGGLAAWAGFTLPSALLLMAFAALADRLAGPLGLDLLHGLKLVALPLPTHFLAAPLLALTDSCYRAGALVFGGGHVVLPLLREAFVSPGWIEDGRFLAGYGAAQAVAGTAVHLRRLSRRQRYHRRPQPSRRYAGVDSDFPARPADPAGRVAVLAPAAPGRECPGGDARDQRDGSRPAGRRPLRPDVDRHDPHPNRSGPRPDRLRAADGSPSPPWIVVALAATASLLLSS